MPLPKYKGSWLNESCRSPTTNFSGLSFLFQPCQLKIRAHKRPIKIVSVIFI